MSSKAEHCAAAAGLPDLLACVAAELAAETDVRRWWVAFSGGVDSSLLLELCRRLPLAQPLLAVHIDHQLQPDSAAWAEHCRRQCARLGVPLTLCRVAPASASEASARDARYRAFEQLLQPGDCLLLAQHADDQAETLLLRLLRGSGVAGMAGMPRCRPLGQGRLLRPLLAQPRARLEAVAAALGLNPIEDPSNARDDYARNWLRRHILPPLKQRWPALLARCRDTAAVMRDAAQLLEERAAEDLQQCQRADGSLDLLQWQQLSAPRQRNLLHHWIAAACGQRLSRQRLLQLQQTLLDARTDAQPRERLRGWQLRRHRQQLHLLPDPLPQPVTAPLPLQVGTGCRLAQGWLDWQPAAQGLPPGLALTLRYRQGGERLRPQGRGGSVSLKQLLQEAGLPPWLRPLQPLLYCADEIVAVPGICLCEGYGVEQGLLPQWHAFGLS